MNPFEVNVFDRVGRLLPMIFFGAIMIFIIFNLKNFIFNSLEKNETLLFISVLLFCAPFAVYDPSFFYPRFLLIPHVIFLIFNSSLSNELNIESLKVKKS